MEWLKGKKTYLLSVALLLDGVLWNFGIITEGVAITVATFILPLLPGTLRAGISNTLQKAGKLIPPPTP